MSQYLEDILNQPDVIRNVISEGRHERECEIRRFLPVARSHNPVFTGMGSSLFSGVFATYFLWKYGTWAISWDASELLTSPRDILPQEMLLFAISQSGRSIETRRLVERSQDVLQVASLTNCVANPISEAAHFRFLMHAGEESAVATKTYVASLASMFLLCGAWIGLHQSRLDKQLLKISDAMESFLENWEKRVEQSASVMHAASSITAFGSGFDLPTALQAALNLKEVVHVGSDGTSTGQFVHGSIEGIGATLCYVVLATQEASYSRNIRLARRICDYGGKTLVITRNKVDVSDRRMIVIEIPQGPDWSAPFLAVLPVQLLALELAKMRNLVPGMFERVGKVVDEE